MPSATHLPMHPPFIDYPIMPSQYITFVVYMYCITEPSMFFGLCSFLLFHFSLSLPRKVFSEGPAQLVDAMMTSDLSSILVRCIHLFLDLSPPTPPPTHRSYPGIIYIYINCTSHTLIYIPIAPVIPWYIYIYLLPSHTLVFIYIPTAPVIPQ